jgi:hypothetical protein
MREMGVGMAVGLHGVRSLASSRWQLLLRCSKATLRSVACSCALPSVSTHAREEHAWRGSPRYRHAWRLAARSGCLQLRASRIH